MSDNEQPEEVLLQLKLEWDSTDDFVTNYANQVLVTHAGRKEFYLVFGEATPPMLIDATQDMIPDKLRVRVVAKIALSPATMIEFANAINTNVDRFLSIQSSQQEIP